MITFISSNLFGITVPVVGVLAGIIAVLSGFDIDLEPNQYQGAFTIMRLMISIIPAIILSYFFYINIH